jgi:hypothetical protein
MRRGTDRLGRIGRVVSQKKPQFRSTTTWNFEPGPKIAASCTGEVQVARQTRTFSYEWFSIHRSDCTGCCYRQVKLK